ncbi:MAG: hypothetical protein QF441_15200 [Bacteriovoracaceae bacterium]|jgi:peptidyl-prolyl cis-trans isomerase SurA|nr:hypothetical protein [Halobacteriovoraceae bacterium]MDP7321953.1 hypothetical protein [Bacteriovoracaceae bacterium]
MNKLFFFILFIATSSHAVILDKIAGVINDKIFTLSEIKRIKQTVPIRQEIAPFIYTKNNFTHSEILKLMQDSFIIQDKLSELGFVVSDDSVESRINETQKGLGLNRNELLKFLESKGITFNEYFELLRNAMQYSIFQRRIIGPLVTITDQELKNRYYKLNQNNKALSFIYKVYDFSIAESKVQNADYSTFPQILERYKRTGNIPQIYSDIETNDLGKLSGEDLPKELSDLLKNTEEKSFSDLYIKDGVIHSFYIESKDLSESSDFLKNRNMIYNQIFLERSKKISQSWFDRERINYYILNNL